MSTLPPQSGSPHINGNELKIPVRSSGTEERAFPALPQTSDGAGTSRETGHAHEAGGARGTSTPASEASMYSTITDAGTPEEPSFGGLGAPTNAQDTTVYSRQAPAATHEVVNRDIHHVREERIQRDMHHYDVVHRIQPVLDVEVLPTRHYALDGDGAKVEIDPNHLLGRGETFRSHIGSHIAAAPTAPRADAGQHAPATLIQSDGEYRDKHGAEAVTAEESRAVQTRKAAAPADGIGHDETWQVHHRHPDPTVQQGSTIIDDQHHTAVRGDTHPTQEGQSNFHKTLAAQLGPQPPSNAGGPAFGQPSTANRVDHLNAPSGAKPPLGIKAATLPGSAAGSQAAPGHAALSPMVSSAPPTFADSDWKRGLGRRIVNKLRRARDKFTRKLSV